METDSQKQTETEAKAGPKELLVNKRQSRKTVEKDVPVSSFEGYDSDAGNRYGMKERARCSADETKQKVRKLLAEEAEMVTGVFHYHELQGGSLSVFQRKYKELPAFQQTFVDGMTYTIPRWVARWLNGVDKASKAYQGIIHSGAFPVYKHETTSVNGQLSHLQPVGRWTRRFSFQSQEFLT